MKIIKITKHLEQKGLPFIWQVNSLILVFASFLVIFINDPILSLIIEVPALVVLLSGMYLGTLSHNKNKVFRNILVTGAAFVISSLVIQSLGFLNIPINNKGIPFFLEQVGAIFIITFAFMYLNMFEKKYRIGGISIDFTLSLIACVFFYLLITPATLHWLFYELESKQLVLVIDIFIATTLVIISIFHYFLSRSRELEDIIRLLMSAMLLVHFGLDLLVSLNQVSNPIFASKVSRSTVEFNGALIVIYLFTEKFNINYSDVAPKQVSQKFMWTASIIAILTIPLGLLILSFKGVDSLNLFIIGVFSLFLSSIVIWRIFLLLTKSRIQRKRLQIATQTNQLTYLPNYQGYISQLTLASLRNVLVVAINIEDFKSINDLYGRSSGDQVLINIGEKLKKIPRVFFTAHSHSDLFLTVFQTSEHDIDDIMDSLKHHLGIWNTINGKQITVPLTYGASYSKEIIDPEILSQQAEQALKRARTERSSYVLFKERRESTRLQRHEIRDILQQAVDDNYLPVHFQPIYNLNDGSLKALELLIRVDSKEHGLLLPGQFLEQAKSYGLLTSLTQVCIRMVAKHYSELPKTIININLPPYMLKSPKLLNNFIKVFKDDDLPASRFCIEITEDEGIETKELIPAIKKLRTHGFSIAMDDFGTGYSSLDRLSVLDVDAVKIDRSLLLTAASGSTEILEWAISLAKRLGVSAVVEGVETLEQLNMVKMLGADSVQGFLYSRPVPAFNVSNIALNSNDISIV